MLTRSQVAARLGKSVATVRRLEHIHLHPRRDATGVYRFSDEEVELLAAAIARRGIAQAGTPRAPDWKGWLANRLRQQTRRHDPSGARRPTRDAAPVGATGRDLAEEHAQLRRCAAALADLVLELTTPAQRRHLGAEVLETLYDLAGR
jgi:hypothetical protein